MNRWQEIWNQRTVGLTEQLSLEDLLQLDGFAAGAGAITPPVWRAYVERRADEMRLAAGTSVFEVGCGSGAFLWPLHERGCRVSGIDYSSALIATAQRAIPAGTWRVGEADQPLGEKAYDAVIANSVFHYFPTAEYAKRVVHTMMTAARRAVAILDVPDTRLAAFDIAHRHKVLGKREYEKLYVGLNHLTFMPEWFEQQVSNNWSLKTLRQDIPNYGNNPYRFNVIMTRGAD